MRKSILIFWHSTNMYWCSWMYKQQSLSWVLASLSSWGLKVLAARFLPAQKVLSNLLWWLFSTKLMVTRVQLSSLSIILLVCLLCSLLPNTYPGPFLFWSLKSASHLTPIGRRCPQTESRRHCSLSLCSRQSFCLVSNLWKQLSCVFGTNSYLFIPT